MGQKLQPVKNFAIIIVTALLLALVHGFVVRSGKLPIAQPETQSMENAVRAENYIYEELREPAVLVGTSLSAHLGSEQIYNLAFIGGAVRSGLEIVSSSPHRPQIVLIETNFLNKPAEPELADIPDDRLRQWLPQFQSRQRPVGVALALVKELAGGSDLEIGLPEGRREEAWMEKVAHQREKLSAPFEAGQIEAMAVELAATVRGFEAMGIKAVLYEMPIEPALASLPRPVAIREAIAIALPDYPVVALQVERLMTTDGIHLTRSGVEQVKRELDAIVSAVVGRSAE